MNTFYVLSSSPQQRSLRLPAAQLYLGALYNASITHARRFAKRDADVRILSPKLGLLTQTRPLEPYSYDHSTTAHHEQLIQSIRAELPRTGTLPLRIVILTPEADTALFRAACAETRFEKVPLRTPLSNLSHDEQLQWLQAPTYPIEYSIELPTSQRLSPTENERLGGAARAAATWWSEQLMKQAPPPDPTLFANTLALELCKTWDEVASKSRGEWPEDITFPVTYQHTNSPIEAALQAIGLTPREWWKRESSAPRVPIAMHFSLASVSVGANDRTAVIFR